MIENNIDDAFRTRGGHCVSQSTNISAVLELAGMDHLHFTYQSLTMDKSHTIVYLPAYGVTFDDGWVVRKKTM